MEWRNRRIIGFKCCEMLLCGELYDLHSATHPNSIEFKASSSLNMFPRFSKRTVYGHAFTFYEGTEENPALKGKNRCLDLRRGLVLVV